jgi:hypothetical protein
MFRGMMVGNLHYFTNPVPGQAQDCIAELIDICVDLVKYDMKTEVHVVGLWSDKCLSWAKFRGQAPLHPLPRPDWRLDSLLFGLWGTTRNVYVLCTSNK